MAASLGTRLTRVWVGFTLVLVFGCSFTLCSRKLQETQDTQDRSHQLAVSLHISKSPSTIWVKVDDWREGLLDYLRPAKTVTSSDGEVVHLLSKGRIYRRMMLEGAQKSQAVYQMLPRNTQVPPHGPDPRHN